MKIRSYKGPSLETLYEAIRKELGSEAVVVSARQVEPKRPLMGALLGGGRQYEVIAVAEDAAADQHLLDRFGRPELSELTDLQARKWREMEQALQHLRRDVRGLARGAAREGGADAPAWAADWDPRFVKQLRALGCDGDEAPGEDALRAALESLARVVPDFPVTGRTVPHVIVFVGPTGSGKTTTLAKLAARWCLNRRLNIGLITTDTFRVAAVDQIREYATLLGLELAVAFSATEAAHAAQRFKDKDVILVDTPGRNHYDQIGLAGIRNVLKGLGPVTVLLHLPMVLDRRHVAELIGNFQALGPNYLVLTKSDETHRYAMLTSVLCETDCPIAFVTDGQRVPQDIHPATAGELAEMLMPQPRETQPAVASEHAARV